MKTETVFQILGEGGSLAILRETQAASEKFIYYHTEYDPSDEGHEINKRFEYDSFEEPFWLITEKYIWYKLHLGSVKEKYRLFVSEQLIKKLNTESVMPDEIQYTKERLERKLNIKLSYNETEHKDGGVWTCEYLNTTEV